MNKLKTREQAEQRALELYPKVPIYSQHYVTNQVGRKAFLQCWDEMQEDKQRSQRISEQSEEKVNKSVQKELLCEMMRKDEESRVYELSKDDIQELIEESEKEINLLEKYNQLREAAEEAVSAFYNHSQCGELLKQAVLKIEKELK